MNALIPTSIPLDEYNAAQAKTMVEKPFQAAVLGAAARWGWLAYHTFDSRRSEPGYPDLHLVHPQRGISLFRELKTMSGRVSSDQAKWIAALTAAGCDVAVWRPIQWLDGTIDRQLFVDDGSPW